MKKNDFYKILITFELLGRFWHILHQIKALDLNFDVDEKKYEFCKKIDFSHPSSKIDNYEKGFKWYEIIFGVLCYKN